MGIRDAISKLPKPGTVKIVYVPGLGDVHVRRLSAAQMLQFPDKEASLHHILQAALDEHDTPLFANLQEVQKLSPAVAFSLLKAVNEVNTLDVETAAKN